MVSSEERYLLFFKVFKEYTWEYFVWWFEKMASILISKFDSVWIFTLNLLFLSEVSKKVLDFLGKLVSEIGLGACSFKYNI